MTDEELTAQGIVESEEYRRQHPHHCVVRFEEMYGFLEDKLTPEHQQLVEKHVANCILCQKSLEDLKRDVEAFTGPS